MEAVHHFEGTVNQVMGDGIMAVLVTSRGAAPVKGLGRPLEVFELAGAAAVRNRLHAAPGRQRSGASSSSGRRATRSSSRRVSGRSWRPEPSRASAEPIGWSGPWRVGEAEACLQSAAALARRQGARSFELRAATSLARLRGELGRRENAGAALAEIHGWSTEGFDTADLIDARVLLDSLASGQ